ncbi:MAG: 50S ribosomal protein L1 [Nitrososphaerota archaeon]|nr:50S ribosomal protein L1 [Nitrososphaerota archaeon]MDG6903929.1 50S ribosomal protein L1 [Nitrososphaerota archaeon]MDG6912702.1 50S ribosomal protein L1 [Nitrososphaerota archaeon]MDG6919158.1 50S ribosomal protein L1 [Nitrososphaerota archaeon]MDG6920562.1 50S ribosomal protein L1 [Nitrososphaerota archaeon]
MLSNQQLAELVKKGKGQSKETKFTQSVEVLISLKEVDPKKTDLNINEIVYLPHPATKQARVCFIGSGDLAVRAKNSNANLVMDPAQLENYGGSKRDAKKLARSYDFFLADTALMPRVGKVLGQALGPKGKIPSPVPPNSPIEAMINRMRTAIRVRSRGSLGVTAMVGDSKLSETDLAENIVAVVNAVSKKLPNGDRNIKTVMVKTTMGKPAKQAVD